MEGRLHTRYAPVRRSQIPKNPTPRLACVKPAASVHPEPGSNSSSYILIMYIRRLAIGSFRIFRFHYSYSICFEISFKTAVNSICLRTCLFLFPLLFQSGCKTKTSFCFSQEKLEKFLRLYFRPIFSFFCQSFKELCVFCGVQM